MLTSRFLLVPDHSGACSSPDPLPGILSPPPLPLLPSVLPRRRDRRAHQADCPCRKSGILVVQLHPQPAPARWLAAAPAHWLAAGSGEESRRRRKVLDDDDEDDGEEGRDQPIRFMEKTLESIGVSDGMGGQGQ